MRVRQAMIDVVRIGEKLAVSLASATVPYDRVGDFTTITSDLCGKPRLDTCGTTEQYGDLLFQALCQHPAIKSELEQIVLTEAPDSAVLHVLIRPPDADCIRWEALCRKPPARFLAVDGACTISRIPYTMIQRAPGLRSFSFPLQMSAFLSPAGITARSELEEIAGQIAAARAAGLDIQCTAYLGEVDLLDEAQAKIDAGTFTGLRVAPIPKDSLEIEKEIRERAPEFLHFFCHGTVEVGSRLLRFASINDWDTGERLGKVTLSVERLKDIQTVASKTWITVLNCCSGAKALPDLHSMALELAKGDSPFAIGMAEPIDSTDATDFTRAFYEALFTIVQARLNGLRPNESTILDFAPAVLPARKKLYAKYQEAPPDAFARWCLPIVYESSTSTPLKVVAVSADMKCRVNTVAKALLALPLDAPNDLRDVLLATLDKDPAVPPGLRPDRFGNIGVA